MNPTHAIGVFGIIVKDGRALILKRPLNMPAYAGKYELPGGSMEPGETPVEGLKREVREETSLHIEPQKLVRTFPFVLHSGLHVLALVYACRHVAGDVRLSDEHIDYAWVGSGDLDSYDFLPDSKDLLRSFFSSMPHASSLDKHEMPQRYRASIDADDDVDIDDFEIMSSGRY